jgi:hypothetical protein
MYIYNGDKGLLGVLGNGNEVRRVARKVVMNFMLDPDLVDALARNAAASNESMSGIVREALRAHLLKIGAAS